MMAQFFINGTEGHVWAGARTVDPECILPGGMLVSSESNGTDDSPDGNEDDTNNGSNGDQDDSTDGTTGGAGTEGGTSAASAVSMMAAWFRTLLAAMFSVVAFGL